MTPFTKTRFLTVIFFTVLSLTGCSQVAAQSLMGALPRGAVKGFAEPYRSIELAASEMGTLSSVAVKEGEQVKTGQILGRLSEKVLAASQAMIESSIRAKGKLNAAKAELDIQQETLSKVRGLFQRKHASQIEVDRAEGQVQVAKARVEAVRDEILLKEYELKRVIAQIEQRRLRSPIDGIVTEVLKDEGEFVSSADPVVFRVVQLDPLLIVFSLPRQLTSELSSGQSIQVAMGERKENASAVVEFVSPVAEAQSGTIRVRVRVPNSEQRWRSGTPCYFIPSLARKKPAPAEPLAKQNKTLNLSPDIAN